MEEITDAYYVHARRVCKHFKINNLGEYHDLYVQSDKIQLADAFENFQNMCLEIYGLDPACFLTEPARQVALKATKVQLNLLTEIDMLLIVEKGIRSGMCHAIYQYGKANNE